MSLVAHVLFGLNAHGSEMLSGECVCVRVLGLEVSALVLGLLRGPAHSSQALRNSNSVLD